jgi:hypothetical protein
LYYTKGLFQQRQDTSLHWPPGNYTIDFVVTNNSTGGSSPLNEALIVYGANDLAGPYTQIGYHSPITRSATNTYSVSVSSAAYYKYIGFVLSKEGPSTGSFINVSVNSATITAHPSIDIGGLKLRQQYYNNDVLQDTEDITLAYTGVGLYRQKLDQVFASYDEVRVTFYKVGGGEEAISETLSIEINNECSNESICLQWVNYLGGVDQWLFTAQKDHGIDIKESGETKENIFPNWPKSYGEFATTITKKTHIDASEFKVVRSQYLTEDQAEAIKYIKTSPVVQIVNSRQDRRTVKVDSDSFIYRKESDKMFYIEFTIEYTDQIPGQRV